MADPRRQVLDRLDRARRQACDAGDHRAELEHTAALLAAADPRLTADLAAAEVAHLRALEHIALLEPIAPGAGTSGAGTGATDSREGRDAHEERASAVERWLRAAAGAHATLDELLGDDETTPGARRAALDPIAASLRRAQEAAGVELSPPAADLVRRERARAGPRTDSPSFLARHADGIGAIWARDGRAWWQERFVARFGSEPPADWWQDDEPTAPGGRVAAHRVSEEWFDASDQAEFFAEMEVRYRSETGLPARGEGWVSEVHLVRCVEAALPGTEVVRQARPGWLDARQSLDILIPSLEIAIEYQGEQHYVALAHWGGEAGLAARRELDERKRDACLRAGVRLVEWRYDEPVSVAAVRARLGLEG